MVVWRLKGDHENSFGFIFFLTLICQIAMGMNVYDRIGNFY